MSREQIQGYLQSGKLIEDVATKAKEAGYDVTVDDVKDFFTGITDTFNALSKELTPEQLDMVTGGAGDKAALSCFGSFIPVDGPMTLRSPLKTDELDSAKLRSPRLPDGEVEK